MHDHVADTEGWPGTTTKRRFLALFIDFICFNAFWGLVVWALSLSGLTGADGPVKYGFFLLMELVFLRQINWSPGNDFLGIHKNTSPEYLKTRRLHFSRQAS